MKSIITTILLIIYLFIYQQKLIAGTAGSEANIETRYIIDMPNAGLIPLNNYNLSIQMFEHGGLLTAFDYSPIKDVSIGLSVSLQRFISGEGIFMSKPIPIALNAKVRIINETKEIPAIALGFSSQGRGYFHSADKRYSIMSPGFFLAVSKNFKSNIGFMGLHAGVNYSLEPLPNDRTPNVYFGMEQSLYKSISLVSELNLQTDESNKYSKGKANLILGIRYSINNSATIELQYRDILNNSLTQDRGLRYLSFDYVTAL